MRILAFEEPDRYLIDLESDNKGVVVQNGVSAGAPIGLATLLSRNEWEVYEGSQDLLATFDVSSMPAPQSDAKR